MTDKPSGTPYIVVGVDGSESSKAALRWAARLAPGLGARIEAVTAWTFPAVIAWTAGNTPEWTAGSAAEKGLVATVDEVFGSARPADLRMRAVEGDPSRVLLEASRQASMVVVGSRGHGGFVGLLLGAVSAQVAEHATCPVLVVHEGRPAEAAS